MKPLIVLVTSFAVLGLLGSLGVPYLADRILVLRVAVAVMFVFAASAHFTRLRTDLAQMVPECLPARPLIVTVTGALELAGAAGLLVPRLAPWAAAGLALLLVGMFPANVSAARRGLELGGAPVTPLGRRTAIQVLFVLAVLVAGFGAPGS